MTSDAMEMTPDDDNSHQLRERTESLLDISSLAFACRPRFFFQPVLHAVIDAKSKNGTGREMVTLPRI